MPVKSKVFVRARVRTQEGQGGGGVGRERSMRLEIVTERGMHAELSFYIHLQASMGSAAAAGWSRQKDAAAQCDSLCSAASTVSSLSMLLCDGRDSSVSSAATPAGASFSWECAQHGDSFGGKLNDMQSRAGQQRSHPYDKAVLAARASSPPAVQGSRVVVISNNESLCNRGFGQFLAKILAN